MGNTEPGNLPNLRVHVLFALVYASAPPPAQTVIGRAASLGWANHNH